MPFRTLSQRLSDPAPLEDGVPEHLRESLLSEIQLFCMDPSLRGFNRSSALLLERESRVGNLLLRGCMEAKGVEEANFLENLRRFDADTLLALLDAAVRTKQSTATRVNQILVEGGSLFEVRTVQVEGKAIRGLERRVPIELENVMNQVPDARARRELDEARSAIFGLNPDYQLGMNHAVRAVEYASVGIVEPNNLRATLGSVAGALTRNEAGFAARSAARRWLARCAFPSGMASACIATGPRLNTNPTRQREPRPRPIASEKDIVLVDWFSREVIVKS